MITFNCPGCAKSFQVKDEFSGRKTKCPQCGAPLLVPALTDPVAAQPRPGAAATPKFCSSCGVPWQAGARFCGGCGALGTGTPTSAIPAVPAPKLTVRCPVCGAENNPNPTNCDRCKLPIGNVEALKAMRQNVVAEQRRCRADLLSSEMVGVLGDDEFICYLASAERSSKFYVVTERRLISFKNVGWINSKFALEMSIDFSAIVSSTEVHIVGDGLMKLRASFTVHTSEGSVEFWFDASTPMFGEDESREGTNLFVKLRDAYQAYLGGTTVAGALLMRAKL